MSYNVKIAFTVTNTADNTVSETSQTYEGLDYTKLMAMEKAVIPAVQNVIFALGDAKSQGK